MFPLNWSEVLVRSCDVKSNVGFLWKEAQAMVWEESVLFNLKCLFLVFLHFEIFSPPAIDDTLGISHNY